MFQNHLVCLCNLLPCSSPPSVEESFSEVSLYTDTPLLQTSVCVMTNLPQLVLNDYFKATPVANFQFFTFPKLSSQPLLLQIKREIQSN